MNNAKPIKTKQQFAYEKIRSEILKGELPPGRRIILSTLAGQFGVSEIPIREALKRLEAEGLVTNTPHVGFEVTAPDFKNQTQVFAVRQLLEGHATYLTAQRITSAKLKILSNLIEEMRKNAGNNALMVELNGKFHDLIYRSCGNQVLYGLIQQTWAMAARTRSIFFLINDRASASIKEHEEIYRHLEAHDPEKAQRALQEHKQRAYDLLCQYSFKLSTFR
ncbi:MAG: GntR family transcriptional regulator [Thermodesulfobacteriota bacterium]